MRSFHNVSKKNLATFLALAALIFLVGRFTGHRSAMDEVAKSRAQCNEYVFTGDTKAWNCKGAPEHNEPYFEAWAQKIVCSGWTVADVGSNKGMFTKSFAKMVGPNGRVVGFDLLRENIVTARKNVDDAGCGKVVTLVNKALGAGDRETVTVTFISTEESFTEEGININPKQLHKFTAEETSLDRYFYHDEVHAVKIDTEGAAGAIFKGMNRTLAMYKPVIFFERHNIHEELAVMPILHAHGYQMWAAKNGKKLPGTPLKAEDGWDVNGLDARQAVTYLNVALPPGKEHYMEGKMDHCQYAF